MTRPQFHSRDAASPRLPSVRSPSDRRRRGGPLAGSRARSSALALALVGLACGPGPAGSAGTSESATSDASTSSPTSAGTSAGSDSGTASSGSTSSTSGTASSTGTGTTTGGTETTTTSDTTGNVSDSSSFIDGFCDFGADGVAPPGSGPAVRCTPPLHPCDVFAQDCPEGEKCVPYDSNGDGVADTDQCFPVHPEPAGPGEPCTTELVPWSGWDDCEFGSVCLVDEPDTLEGTCVEQCTGTPGDPECPESTFCSIANDGVLTLCLPTCDPLEGAQACEPGKVCAPTLNGVDFVCVALADPSAGPGEPCDFLNGCDPGLACVAADYVPGCADNGCCAPFCDLMSPVCDDIPGSECTSWFEMPNPDHPDLGVCVDLP